jgi:acyl carrier protein
MIFEKLTAIIADHLGCDAAGIKENTTFEEFGIDSLDTVEMVMQLEDELGFEIELEGKMATVGELASFIESKKG